MWNRNTMTVQIAHRQNNCIEKFHWFCCNRQTNSASWPLGALAIIYEFDQHNDTYFQYLGCIGSPEPLDSEIRKFRLLEKLLYRVSQNKVCGRWKWFCDTKNMNIWSGIDQNTKPPSFLIIKHQKTLKNKENCLILSQLPQ